MNQPSTTLIVRFLNVYFPGLAVLLNTQFSKKLFGVLSSKAASLIHFGRTRMIKNTPEFCFQNANPVDILAPEFFSWTQIEEGRPQVVYVSRPDAGARRVGIAKGLKSFVQIFMADDVAGCRELMAMLSEADRQIVSEAANHKQESGEWEWFNREIGGTDA